ncbi:DUF72 domain-containing protein [bacterium]|nr:DUF72 domain-containing protein [bacterium]
MILVGTASWADKSLVDSGKFYPPEVKNAEERLRYYAGHFPLVEVDSSYYALPSPTVAQAWAERTPEGFVFNVKAFRLFTGHQALPKVLPKDLREALGAEPNKNIYLRDLPAEIREELWQRMREAIQPLKDAGKFGCWHFQFAPWLAFHPENRALLEDCRRQLADDQLAVEFRNHSWYEQKHQRYTLDFLSELRASHVVVDAPRGVKPEIPTVWAVTDARLALLRLHGRNAETWNKKGLKTSSERFNYDYSDEELGELLPGLRQLNEQASQVDVLFNNNHEDQGQRNAASLSRMLR